MELLTGDLYVATEEEDNGTMKLYYLHLGCHSVSPSCCNPAEKDYDDKNCIA